MPKKGIQKNGANKKLHTKLIKQKKTKEQEAQNTRKMKLRDIIQKSKNDPAE